MAVSIVNRGSGNDLVINIYATHLVKLKSLQARGDRAKLANLF
jgi:hypothetical protein